MKRGICIALFLPVLGCHGNMEPRTVLPGTDSCHYCQMTIVDERFTTQLVSEKGKHFIFDDVHCMNAFVQEADSNSLQIAKVYLSDFAYPGHYITPEKSFFLRSDNLRSPMGGNTATFSEESSLLETQVILGGEIVSFETLFYISP